MLIQENFRRLSDIQKDFVIEAILTGKKTIVNYFSYPTGTSYDSYIFEQDSHGKQTDPRITLLFERAFNQVFEAVATSRLEHLDVTRLDNKVALELKVVGLEWPVYLSFYDGRQAICGELNTNRGGTTYQVGIEYEEVIPAGI